MTIAQAFNEIAVAQGGTASKSGTITGAIDALNDALAGSDQQAASTIEDAVRLLGANIGGGGEGGGDGDATEYNVVCYEYEYGDSEEITLTQVPTYVYEAEWKEDAVNPGEYWWAPKLDAPVDKAAAGTFLMLNIESGGIYFTTEDFLNDTGKTVPQTFNLWVMPSRDVACICEALGEATS